MVLKTLSAYIASSELGLMVPLNLSPDSVIIGMKSSGLEPSLFSTRTT
ncbi:hypothetical protein [Vulcanisaeta sp. EB80]|nr:hypothetical protein [Vulcanisaeta sp. EB80]